MLNNISIFSSSSVDRWKYENIKIYMDNKEPLKIGNIETIEKIFKKHLWFLPSSVQKTNLAYSLQYFFFMIELYNAYHLPKSLEHIFIQQLIVSGHSICESLLFLTLKQEKKLQENKKYYLLGLAEIIKAMIKDTFYKDVLFDRLKTLNNKRKLIHPERQKESYAKVFYLNNEVVLTVFLLFDQIKNFYNQELKKIN